MNSTTYYIEVEPENITKWVTMVCEKGLSPKFIGKDDKGNAAYECTVVAQYEKKILSKHSLYFGSIIHEKK